MESKRIFHRRTLQARLAISVSECSERGCRRNSFHCARCFPFMTHPPYNVASDLRDTHFLGPFVWSGSEGSLCRAETFAMTVRNGADHDCEKRTNDSSRQGSDQ